MEFELDDPDQFLIQHSLSLFSEKKTKTNLVNQMTPSRPVKVKVKAI